MVREAAPIPPSMAASLAAAEPASHQVHVRGGQVPPLGELAAASQRARPPAARGGRVGAASAALLALVLVVVAGKQWAGGRVQLGNVPSATAAEAAPTRRETYPLATGSKMAVMARSQHSTFRAEVPAPSARDTVGAGILAQQQLLLRQEQEQREFEKANDQLLAHLGGGSSGAYNSNS